LGGVSERIRFLERVLAENTEELEEIMKLIGEIQEPAEPVYWTMNVVSNED